MVNLNKFASFLFYIIGLYAPTVTEVLLISHIPAIASDVILTYSIILIAVALFAGFELGYCIRMLNDASYDLESSEFYKLRCEVVCPTPGTNALDLLKSFWSTYALIPWFTCNLIFAWVYVAEISRAANICAHIPLIAYFVGICVACAFCTDIKNWRDDASEQHDVFADGTFSV